MPRIIQFNFEDRELLYLDKVKGLDIVQLAVELYADTVVLFARDAWGRAYYDSKVARKAGKLGERDLLHEVVEEARKHGLRVVVMIGHTTNPELYSIHPEWAQRDINGVVISMDTNPVGEKNPALRWPLMCLNSPFLDMVLEEVREVLSYGVAGVFLDSFRYMPDFEKACYCENCRRKYKEETGKELPTTENWDSRAYREVFNWRYMVNARSIEKIYRYLKSLNKDAILVYNNHPAGWKGRANTVVEVARNNLDVVFAECSEADYQPPGFIAEMVKLTAKLSGGKRVWATRNVFHGALTTTSTSPIAIKQGVREVFMASGDPMVLVFSSTYAQSPSFKDPVKEVFAEVEKLEEYMEGAKRLKYAGVVYSNRSRDWAGREDPRHVTDEVRGFYYALAYSGVPVDFVVDHELDEDLFEDYKVLVLPYTASMSRRAVENIEKYSAERGVVATYLTSIMDEEGNYLEEFQLSSVLGVSYRGLLKYPWSYVVLTREHPVTSGVPDRVVLWGDYDRVFRDKRTPPYLGWHARVEPREGVEVLGYVGEPVEEYGHEYENGRSPPLLASVTNNSAVVVNGRHSVYFTGQLGRLYWRLGLLHHEKLILNTTRWVGGEPEVSVETTGLVLFEPYTRSGQLIVHLLNASYDRRLILRGNVDDPLMWHSTVETMMPPRRVIPVEVSLKVKGFEPTKAYSANSGAQLPITEENGYYKVDVKVPEYELVVIDVT